MAGHYLHAGHSLFYDAYYADIFSIVAKWVMVKRWKLLLKIRKHREKDKLFERKFQNYRNYVRPFGYKTAMFTVSIYNSALLSQ